MAGLIQTLLMLTQAHFVPDMQGFWDAWNKPATVQQAIYADAVTCPGSVPVLYERNEFAVPVNRDAALVPAEVYLPKRYISPTNTFPAGRVIAAKKLYLIFCQLRIGGQQAVYNNKRKKDKTQPNQSKNQKYEKEVEINLYIPGNDLARNGRSYIL